MSVMLLMSVFTQHSMLAQRDQPLIMSVQYLVIISTAITYTGTPALSLWLTRNIAMFIRSEQSRIKFQGDTGFVRKL